MKSKLATVCLAALFAISVSGCNEKAPIDVEKRVTLTAKPIPAKARKDVKSEQAEFDCRTHAADKICEVPWKDKTVLYCYAKKIPKVVRYRSECVK